MQGIELGFPYRMLKTQKEITMKRILIAFFALILVACGTAAPAPSLQPSLAPPEPTQTPVVVVETVVVTVVPTNVPTEVPADTPLPPPTAVPATEAPAATEPPAEPAAASGSGPITVDDALGVGWFVSMTRDRNDFSLRCQLNKQITFNAKATSPDIQQVDFWYRFEDRSNGAVFEWVNAGKMVPDGNGNFTLTLSGDQVNPNFRKPNSWFDYQFVGYNATGVVGRSEKIVQTVSYTFDCP
jgi:hypothetical protein